MTRVLISLLILLFAAAPAAAEQPAAAPAETAGAEAVCATPSTDVDAVLEQVRERYKGRAFCMNFEQASQLSGMGMEDTASGSACFEYPDKMNWHYLVPEEQHVISDGQSLWIYRPLDNQVMVGDAARFFGGGGGASFFSDPAVLSSQFEVSPGAPALAEKWGVDGTVLELEPREPRPEFALLYLVVDKETHDILLSASYNEYGDETRIRFLDPEFFGDLPDSTFRFQPPEGVDVIRMEEAQ